MPSTVMRAIVIAGAALLASALAAVPAVARPAPAAPSLVQAARGALAPAALRSPAPSTSAATGGILIGVDAVGPRSAWAVGAAGRDPTGTHSSKVLILRWNGTDWKRMPAPGFPDASAVMAVTSLSRSNAWAVGEDRGDFGGSWTGRKLILHWNGHAWKQVPSPHPRNHAVLYSVAAVSAHDVWAVGETESQLPVIAHWNGASWRNVSAPAGLFGGLVSVVAVAPDNVWAAGINGGDKPLVIHWNGNKWRQVGSPARVGGLNSVTAISPRSVWAVGTRGLPPPSGTQHPVLSHWNGTKWTNVRSPVANGELFTLARGSARSVWAVGGTGVFTRHARLVIAHWNGATWTQASAPRPAGVSLLFGASATSAGRAWAVGATAAGGTDATLILHWNGKAWKVMPS